MRPPGPRRSGTRAVVVGGGVAGWMAAAFLRRLLRRSGWTVTIVAPPPRTQSRSAIVTGPDFTRFLRSADIDEAIFMRRTGATYRLGSDVRDWFEPGSRHRLPLGPTGPRPHGRDLFHFWLKQHLAGDTTAAYADFSAQACAMARGAGPARPDGTSPILEAGDYGFHVEEAGLAAFFRDWALSEGVILREGHARAVRPTGSDDVEALDLGDGLHVAADVVVDATGGELERDRAADAIPMLRATTGRGRPDDARPSATLCRGGAAGWVQAVPLIDRTIWTLVHDTSLDDGAAASLLHEIAGPCFDIAHRDVPLVPREPRWADNVVSLGTLPGGAAPVLGLDLVPIQRALEAFLDYLPRRGGHEPLRAAFNGRMAGLGAALLDAVALHVALSRRPEPFWRGLRERPLSDALRARLDLFETAGIVEASPDAGFDETAHYHVLIGAGILPRRAFAPVDLVDGREVGRFLASVGERTRALVGSLAPHAEMLERLHDVPASTAMAPAPSAAVTPPRAERDRFAALRRSPHGSRLVDLIVGLGQPFGFERSVKAAGGRLQTDRFLLSVHRTGLGLDPSRELERLAGTLGLPERERAEAMSLIGEADIVHLGFEDGAAGPLYKLYVEWSSQADRAWQTGQDAPGAEPILVHRAYKWSAEGQEPPVVTLYHWPRVRTPDEIAARLSAVFGDEDDTVVRLAHAVLDIVREHGTGLPHYLEAAEATNPRLSYDLNLYATGLSVAAIERLLRQVFAELSVPPEEIEQALAERRHDKLGHVAGGVGRDGRAFVTLYSGVAGR